MNAQTHALAVHMLKQGKPLSEIGDATGLLDRGVMQIAKEVSQQHGTATPAARVLPQPSHPTASATTGIGAHAVPSPLARLLEDASGHSKARVRNLASKIEGDLDRLRELLSEHAQQENAKRQAEQAKQAAKAEISRLEQQLAAAKAKLRGKPTVKADKATPTTTGDYACACGRLFSNAQGLGKHRVTCTSNAA